jgi:pimeloyl-ACP methyl ester carboxylesterase
MRHEALRQGADGWADEAMAIIGAWDFALNEVRVPVTWFHGVEDKTVHISAARRLAQQLPNCELIEMPAAGHQITVERRAIEDALASRPGTTCPFDSVHPPPRGSSGAS